jgi:hypothetical protein
MLLGVDLLTGIEPSKRTFPLASQQPLSTSVRTALNEHHDRSVDPANRLDASLNAG